MLSVPRNILKDMRVITGYALKMLIRMVKTWHQK